MRKREWKEEGINGLKASVEIKHKEKGKNNNSVKKCMRQWLEWNDFSSYEGENGKNILLDIFT